MHSGFNYIRKIRKNLEHEDPPHTHIVKTRTNSSSVVILQLKNKIEPQLLGFQSKSGFNEDTKCVIHNMGNVDAKQSRS